MEDTVLQRGLPSTDVLAEAEYSKYEKETAA